VSSEITELAFSLFRPALKQLDVQNLQRTPSIVRASQHPDLVKAGMGRGIIIAHKTAILNGKKGCATIVLDKTHDLFLLSISINGDLFIDNSYTLRTQRKMVAVHEFVHGCSHMLLSTYFKSNYIESMEKSIINKVIMTTSDEFIAMLLTIGKLGAEDGAVNQPFPDGHFRLRGDGFEGNYAELNIDLYIVVSAYT
jgi:hypothetical protein